MIGQCDHCTQVATLTDVGHGILYCDDCRVQEHWLVAEQKLKSAGKLVNQHGATRQLRNAYPGERRGPLTREDKARICILAREAFAKMHDREPATQAELDAWRREQQKKACGFGSLTHCLQQHMPALEAHFLDLKGESGKAFKRLMKPEMDDKSVVLGVLRGNLAKFGLAEGYAATICRSKCKCALAEASVRQLWSVVYQIRKNQLRKGRKGSWKKAAN